MGRADMLPRPPNTPATSPARLDGLAIDTPLRDPVELGQVQGIAIANDQRQTAAWLRRNDFDGFSLDETVISSDAGSVEQRLWDVRAWPRFMPHVSAVVLNYDDGRYQQYTMQLDDDEALPLTVRVARRCRPGHIAFFLPAPAGWLRHHCGDWFIEPATQDATHLTLVQYWTGHAKAAPRNLSRSGMTGAQGRVALEALKRRLEGSA